MEIPRKSLGLEHLVNLDTYIATWSWTCFLTLTRQKAHAHFAAVDSKHTERISHPMNVSQYLATNLSGYFAGMSSKQKT